MLSLLEASVEEIMSMKAKIQAPAFARKRKKIHKLEIIKKKSIYGMWMEPILFVKAYLYDPGDVARLAAIIDVSRF